ncbi:MAG: hypothetical protein GY758_32820 [Fuerstiella sp.]|nr:hypothetical protein [Fuerstiella sp.]MCP4854567.1 hypothetical protein [Fuerstiella sp.]
MKLGAGTALRSVAAYLTQQGPLSGPTDAMRGSPNTAALMTWATSGQHGERGTSVP